MAAICRAQRVCLPPSLPILSGDGLKKDPFTHTAGCCSFPSFPPCFRGRFPHFQSGLESTVRHRTHFTIPLLRDTPTRLHKVCSIPESNQPQVCGCKFVDHSRCLSFRRAWPRRRDSRQRLSIIVHALPPIRDEEAGKDPQKFMVELERAWHISKRPKPVPCSTCSAEGEVECPWCNGTGFLVLGDTMVCDVNDHDRSCRVCQGKGSIKCDDCKGTGKRAGWLERVPPHDSDDRFRFPR